jgi:pimeloyl-ACP methyl ester carboxylesterase
MLEFRCITPFSVALAMLPVLLGVLSFHRGPLPGEPKGTYATIEGVRVRYLDTGGDGPAAVLLHGFASSFDTWRPVVAALESSHRVLALDLKGFGWTERPEGDYSPEAQARLVLGLLDFRGVERAAFVGHSWGSSVALAAALAAPKRVSRLAFYGAWAYEEQLPAFFTWARAPGVGETLFSLYYTDRADERIGFAFHDERFVTPEMVEDVKSSLERPGTVAAALAAVRGQRYAAMQPLYKTIEQQALLLWGREDRITRLDAGERLARDLPNARLVVYPRCGHFPMIEARDASNRDLVAFLHEDARKDEHRAGG